MTTLASPPTTADRLGTLLRLAWPVVLARATQAVIGFCDALFVAPLGEVPLAAVTTGAMNTFTWIMLPMGTVFILQSFAAQLRGRGELEAVRRYAWYGVMLAMGAGLLALPAIFFVPRVVALVGYPPEVASSMSTYMAIRLLSVGGAVGTEALGNWYGGLGNTRLAMFAGVVAMVTNVIGCWVLIEPHFGLPGYGVAGAAWASVVASWLGFGVVLGAFLLGRGFDAAAYPTLGKLRGREIARVLRFGLPNGMNWFLEFAAFVLFINFVVGHLGTAVLAAFNVVMQLNSLAFMPAFGLSSAGAILVGEVIGRRALDDVWPIVRLTAIVASVWMLSVGLLYFTMPDAHMGLFRAHDTDPHGELMVVGAKMLALATFWQLFDALGMAFGEALRAAGDTTWCMLARIVLAWLVFTPLAWAGVFVFGGGAVTVMVSLIAYIALLALVLGLRFASGRWRSIDLVGTEPTLVA